MSRIHALYSTTLTMSELLSQKITSTNREEVMQKIDDLLELREKQMEYIKPPFTKEEQHLGEQVIQLNEQISKKMDHLFESIKTDMRLVKKRKESNRSYINPYGKIKSTDGMFMDSKQ